MITQAALLLLAVAKEWQHTRIAAGQRRAAEHEAMVRALTALGTGRRRVRVRHRGATGEWSLDCAASHRPVRTRAAADRDVRRGR